MAEPIGKVVIIGGGTAGWMTAAMMSRQLGNRVKIELVESDTIGTIGVGEATIPPIQLFNNVMGIDENQFLRNTKGTFKLGIEFTNWGQIGDRYMHAFGPIGRQAGMIDFYHYWLRAKSEGLSDDLWDFSLNNQAAMAGRFDRLDKIPNTPIAGITHAYHFDAGLYAAFLRKGSEQSGVTRTEGKINKVNLRADDGFIESVDLEKGQRIEGDLFIDCSGFRGLLIEGALETGYEDWSHWLPCDTAIAVPSANKGPGRPYTQSIAHSAGWQWRIPLQHRTGNGHVFSSADMSTDEATAILMSNLEGEALAEPRTIPFSAGMRRKFWNKNCVAIGLSSGFLEPLESTAIHVIQTSITRLMLMFPNMSFDQVDIDEYNRQQVFDFERIRDFIILHYKLTNRNDSNFWMRARGMEVPEGVSQKIDQFRANGRIFRNLSDLFTENAWLQVMYGQGVRPENHHPLADALTDQQLGQYLGDIKTIIEKTVPRLPTQEDYIARNCATNP